MYLVVPFFVKNDLVTILKSTFIPDIQWNADYLGILVAILGTTISPYLFFWQATMEVEKQKQLKRGMMVNKRIISEMKKDVDFGMLFSNIVMYFIILTASSVLFNGGVHQINTVQDAATALKPLAGNSAYLLFAIGIIGTGLLAIPVLSGSLSYVFSETFGWKEGLDKKFNEARLFYVVIAISLLVGLAINYTGISAIKALIYTAILYGLTAPFLIAVILHIGNNKKIMKQYTNNKLSNVLGFSTLIIMTVAAAFLIYLQISH